MRRLLRLLSLVAVAFVLGGGGGELQDAAALESAGARYAMGDYAGAQAEYEAFVRAVEAERGPDVLVLAQAWEGIGMCRISLGDPATGASYFQRAVDSRLRISGMTT